MEGNDGNMVADEAYKMERIKRAIESKIEDAERYGDSTYFEGKVDGLRYALEMVKTWGKPGLKRK